jgi:hypothetical protein
MNLLTIGLFASAQPINLSSECCDMNGEWKGKAVRHLTLRGVHIEYAPHAAGTLNKRPRRRLRVVSLLQSHRGLVHQ